MRPDVVKHADEIAETWRRDALAHFGNDQRLTWIRYPVLFGEVRDVPVYRGAVIEGDGVRYVADVFMPATRSGGYGGWVRAGDGWRCAFLDDGRWTLDDLPGMRIAEMPDGIAPLRRVEG